MTALRGYNFQFEQELQIKKKAIGVLRNITNQEPSHIIYLLYYPCIIQPLTQKMIIQNEREI